MTKSVRIENADTSQYQVRVRVYEKVNPLHFAPGEAPPDALVSETILSHPTAMTTPAIHSGRYILVDELSVEA